MFRNAEMDPENSLEKEQVLGDVDLTLHHHVQDSLIQEREDEISSFMHKEDVTEYLPKVPHGYIIRPSVEDLRQKSLLQLKALDSFEVENQHGKIRFQRISKEHGIDVTNVEIGKDV